MWVLRLQTSHGTALWLMAIVLEHAKHFGFPLFMLLIGQKIISLFRATITLWP